MADVIRKATNRFTKGLVMDFSPENTKNEVLTHALNATLLTFNGNELSLQNDLGNARVETAYLPDGYMPVGTCEYGGIIYIVSYNPLEDKSQIGCFPSPERNISSDELGREGEFITKDYFLKFVDGKPDVSGKILHNSQYVLLKNDNLNPGDKFIVCADKQIYNEKLQDLFVTPNKDLSTVKDSDYKPISNPIIALNVVSIEDSGKIVYLNSDIRSYEIINKYNANGSEHSSVYKYHILGEMAENDGIYDQASVDVDKYRNVLNSGYSVFKSKTSGKLAILAELVMIDSYSVTHEVRPRYKEDKTIVEGTFDVIIHTDITPTIELSNYQTVPKLQYYYLENSQGYIQTLPNYNKETKIPLYEINDLGINTGKFNKEFLDYTKLSDVYELVQGENLDLSLTLRKAGKFNFPKPYTYNGRMVTYDNDVTGTTNESVYTKFTEGKYHRLDYSLLMGNYIYYTDELLAKFYYYDGSGNAYLEYTEETLDDSYEYYKEKDVHTYYDVKRDTAYNKSGQDLYKIISEIHFANDKLVSDTTIEKFLQQEIITFRVATKNDIAKGDALYYKDGDSYVSLTGSPKDNETYYVRKVEYSYVSIGYVVDTSTIKGDIYYYPGTKNYELATKEEKAKYFDFLTYPMEQEPPYGCPITLYWRETKLEYVPMTEHELNNYKELDIKLFYNTNYVLIDDISLYRKENQLFIVVPIDTFVSSEYFIPNKLYNYVNGNKPDTVEYPKDDEIFLYTVADFIPDNIDKDSGNFLSYNSLKLANIKIPSVVSNNGLDLPFKYDYTIVPCMNYGKLEHLAVSNTVDFSKLHAFNQSKFTTWKYRIDDNQLRLTFGADVYDTYETNKVDGLVIEFYDCWGFAGSIEVTDKKAYSGVFTKVIPLNSLLAISTNKVLDNGYTKDFIRNINIKEATDSSGKIILGKFIFNNKETSLLGSSRGWDIDEDFNDCGTLYSNILYGVKTYLRRTTENGKEFIPKNEFFLYTLPIYNDFYYTVNDFSNLKNPELDFMLTYKLKDTSDRVPYAQEGIVNGYNATDKENVGSYLGGFYDITQSSTLNLTKFYKYKGQTELYLEVGLKKDYELLNLSYDSDINKRFSCNLWLLSDHKEEESFTVNSGVEGLTGVNQILNYTTKDITIDPSVNKLSFEGGSHKYSLAGDKFKLANFINFEGDTPVKINYEFVVGYNATISEIRNTLVQATTVCALFHMKSDGEYNYEDFGVYLQQSDSETNPDGTAKMDILSSIMFYNEGDAEKEVFGICKLVSIKPGTSIMDLCGYTTSVETDAQEIKTAGKLNSGDPLRQLVSHIGKLTFCQPHVHGFSESKGVNIYNAGGSLGIAPNYGGWRTRDLWDPVHDDDYDDCYGMIPTNVMFNNPKYNMSLNTKNSINYNSEFISTINGNIVSGPIYGYDVGDLKSLVWSSDLKMREYTGFTGQELAVFNQKMIETMKYVYAYNPDYDSLNVNVGNISLLTYNPYFTSNLLSIDSKFMFDEGQSLNDFIYLGPIRFTLYLNYMSDHSKSFDDKKIKIREDMSDPKSKILEQLQFEPGYDYCGTPENYYLISTLTYNTPTPKALEAELEFSASGITVIKHSNGDNTYMEGIPNKKVLYGYNADYDKMIQLDVSNYTIDSDGKLHIKNSGTIEKFTSSLELDEESANLLYLNGYYYFDGNFTNLAGEEIKIGLGASLSLNSNNGYLDLLANGVYTEGVNLYGSVYGMEHGVDAYNSTSGTIYITPKVWVSNYNKSDYTYNVVVDSIELEYSGVLLNDSLSLHYGKSISLINLNYQTLSDLVSLNWKSITLIDNSNNSINATNRDYRVNPDEMMDRINFTELHEQILTTINPDKYGTINLNYNYLVYTNPNYYPGMYPEQNPGYLGSYVNLLFDFKIKKINFTITLTSKLENEPALFISTTKTNDYFDRNSYIYNVKGDYKLTRLRGSSITLNDLVYEPNLEGHRLFIRNNCFTYNNTYRSKIYYRDLSTDKAHSWTLDKLYLNNIYMFTGPCYTISNLYTDD